MDFEGLDLEDGVYSCRLGIGILRTLGLVDF